MKKEVVTQKSTCYQCLYERETGKDGGHSCAVNLQEVIKKLDSRIEELEGTLEAYKAGLEIIAGRKLPADNLMGNRDIAIRTLGSQES